MNYEHIPVLKDECLAQAKDLSHPPKKYLDLTLGRGGHALMFLKAFDGLFCVGVDQDLEAIEQTKKRFESEGMTERSEFHHSSFHVWKKYAEDKNIPQEFDLILMDLGVSSPQLDDFSRGFSFYNDGPLDMRMNQTQTLKASDIVNSYSEDELNDIFKELGEIPSPGRITREIISQRENAPFETTLRLSNLIEAKEGWRKKGSHPATRYFLALRMAVNNEISGLKESLSEIMECLSEDGRLLVITFHSLEDRIVKYIFKESTLGFPVTNKVIKPSREEILKNPRSRSALLRVFQKNSKGETTMSWRKNSDGNVKSWKRKG